MDLLLHRYQNIEYIKNLDVRTCGALIKKAREKERDDRIFQQWTALLPWMDSSNFISFEEYRENVTGANIDTRPAEEILAELDGIEEEFKKGEKNNGNIQTGRVNFC